VVLIAGRQNRYGFHFRYGRPSFLRGQQGYGFHVFIGPRLQRQVVCGYQLSGGRCE